MQYIGPSLQFVVAVFVFREPLHRATLVSFCFCWAGVVIYLVDSLFSARPASVEDEPD
jgi:chloramphenicol-sensitive protein RarD